MTRSTELDFTASAIEIDGEWRVESTFWSVRMIGEKEARRTAEIINNAFRHGRTSMATDLRKLLDEARDD